MPSHITHLLLAEDALQDAGVESPTVGENRSYLALGAQGPDIFYHNQRRKPTALAYGSLMHRKRYGAAVAAMAEWSRDNGLSSDSWAAAWCIGFASHAILDRHTHPYINSRSGWPEAGNPKSDRYRSMHPFLERLVDVELLREKRAIHPNELDFFQIVDCGRQPPRQLIDLLAGSLAKTYPKAAKDSSLKDRLEAAYLDTRGYYQFTNYVDQDYLEAGLKREEDEKMTRKWLSIIHPPEVPQELDVLNTTHQTWPHPCNERETSTKSFLELYNDARAECAGVCRTIHAAWTAPDAGAQIEHAVGNWNLSDGRKTERPCKKRHSAPLPLSELQNRIRESIRSGNGGRLS